jgi:hypothetical protein
MSVSAIGSAPVQAPPQPQKSEQSEGPGPDHDGDSDDKGGAVISSVQAAPTPGTGLAVNKTA